MADIEIKSIAEQKKAVAKELSYMYSNENNYPFDYSIQQEMTRLKNLYDELSKKEKLLEQDAEDN